MKISELQALLSKVANVVGDAEVILKAVESEAETVLHSVGITLGSNGDPATSTVTVEHGAPAPVATGIDQPTSPTDPTEQPPTPAV